MAPPVAALVYAFVANHRGRSYEITYRSAFDEDDAAPPESAEGKRASAQSGVACYPARLTGFDPAISALTGR